ncbi:hypothetical protein GPDM_05441 [Planococcus donghaensis MPA1U2]|uniref:DUF1648 domain-containing protein n=1 Tax=Planococcus donghaensis MPA1U2 TaxID=933115 RepID=E7RF46_9BACL|nr:DUF1648 domain-containing protein [Planococcus donghaensis]EGA90445.1 hypothetical protein GPDM_05441 [Planococcus donghaensis MPA1U2]
MEVDEESPLMLLTSYVKKVGYMNKHQTIEIKRSVFEKFFNAFSLFTFVFVIGFLFTQWNLMPEKIPVHYNEAGEVNRIDNKQELFLLPLIGVVLWVGMTILEKYPHLYNYLNLTEENRRTQYKNGRLMVNVLKNEIILLFSFIIFQSTRIATGKAIGLGTAFEPVFLTVIFGSVLFFIIRMLRS